MVQRQDSKDEVPEKKKIKNKRGRKAVRFAGFASTGPPCPYSESHKRLIERSKQTKTERGGRQKGAGVASAENQGIMDPRG